jgi:hypothetical protein
MDFLRIFLGRFLVVGGGEWIEGGEVDAAKEALGTAGAVYAEVARADAGVAGGEVFGEVGEGVAPLFDEIAELDEGVGTGGGQDVGFGLEAVPLHVLAGTNFGEGEAFELGGLVEESVEGELRVGGARGIPVAG